MIAASPSKIQYNGNGLTTVFSFAMALPSGSTGSELQVYVFDSLGNQTLLSGNYSVDVAGATVTYPTVGGVSPLAAGVLALPAGWQLVIARVVPMSQLLSILTQGVFDGPSFEAAFDRLTMIVQQLAEQLARCIQYPINIAPTAAMIDPSTLVLTVAPLITNASYANLKAQAVAAPTVQFWGFATDLGSAGLVVFYCANAAVGDSGFIVFGGG